MKKTIAISLSPNTEKKDVLLAIKLLFSPWRWLKGDAIEKLEQSFKNYFGVKYAVSFNSGRSAEYAILKAANFGGGDEVLVPAFTCVVVPNSILWLGAKPVYVDLEENTLNMSPVDLKKKITNKSKAVVVQHTFGKPAKMEEIEKIANRNKLLVIEDCAHSLGASFQGRKLGTCGDVAFFSFGRDKVISSVFGGMAISNNPKIGKEILAIQKKIVFPSYFWVLQQLLHPIAFAIILPLYNCLNIGKIILVCLQKVGLLSRAVSKEEKKTEQPRGFPTKFPNALAVLALSQFQRLAKFNQKRKEISQIYRDKLKIKGIKLLSPSPGEIYMRYTIMSKQAKEILDYTKRKGIILGDWYQNIVDPRGVDFTRVGYSKGSCPAAERIAKQVVNLPTYPRMSPREVQEVINVIKEFFKEKR